MSTIAPHEHYWNCEHPTYRFTGGDATRTTGIWSWKKVGTLHCFVCKARPVMKAAERVETQTCRICKQSVQVLVTPVGVCPDCGGVADLPRLRKYWT